MEYQTINPATGKLVKSFDAAKDHEIAKIIVTAQNAFELDWRHRSVADRAQIIAKAASILRDKAEEYAQIITMEMGKRIAEARVEVRLSASILDYYAQHAQEFLEPKQVPEVSGAKVHVHPVGILLGVEPWNYPYYQIARVAAPQLMVGNVLILKHAENVPQCALAFARLFEEAGAPVGVYTNVFASIDQVGTIIDDPRVRGVTLTGSERAGAAVAERAGRNLKKVVLELGGNDAMIVLEDAPLDWAINTALIGRTLNCGQVCVGSKRIIVVGNQRGKEFLSGFKKAMSALQAGDPADANTTLGPISSERALDHLLGQIQRAVDSGAVIECGGHRIDREGFYIEPTILSNINTNAPIYQEEFFGPVASFFVVADEEEAIRLANDTQYGLGGSVMTADPERGEQVAARIDSGMVFVNRPFSTTPQLPFGGIKNSGFGRELSMAGFEEFVNKKLITTDPVGTLPTKPKGS
ncbi:NAD-dependent succinate-semialdehyde dehydrogenase (plasmid) [Cupriavidus sp. KK10]|jgi:succinate-semialdehyde dehydrogenase/glutarate-semialdehyde dehydrogenase|uniref:NAD-dependent succinate-semialdehyde dehydrogenase n=1 Tax=Cupriavidus sp. KK10 TaxID=1478019 RepID=UPI001BA51624|nr:NAD-dependent succinate-semialdehyde dehydrogenase [Cupriavidus sp. KK10]QUN32572.1 NAD-dependent succinate-semialdehyde dehydrogenase [Cupriavidus sp. KK10]